MMLEGRSGARRWAWALLGLWVLSAAACEVYWIDPNQSSTESPPPSGDDDTAGGDDDSASADPNEPCPDGLVCIEAFPYSETFDSGVEGVSNWGSYSCAPTTDEGGAEVLFRVNLVAPGFLNVVISDGEGVDIDVHILGDLDPEDCIVRGHHDAHAALEAGTYYLSADTWVDGSGVAQEGLFTLSAGLLEPEPGDCSMEPGSLDRVGDGGQALAMPATGQVALEAHLVTVDDGYGSEGSGAWPQSGTEDIEDHYALSQEASGFLMHRDQPWCPQEGSEYGQAAYYDKVPVEDEAWYVNMYWAQRPAGGTRMIVRAANGRAVVAAAGYETGPGDLDFIGGASEEIHRYLDTTHGSELTLGFAVDEDLPLGPIDCD